MVEQKSIYSFGQKMFNDGNDNLVISFISFVYEDRRWGN